VEDLGTASDHQVILVWLQAEIESPPFQNYLIGDPPKPGSQQGDRLAEHQKVGLRMKEGCGG
jgi:hypothetical protein